MANLSLKNIQKSYTKDVLTIKDVNLEVADGEFIVIVGPSGCGKSTLLRMVAGLETISAGELSIDGEVVNAIEPKARGVAMVFQNYALYPHMTNRENMSYSLKLSGIPKAKIRARVDAIAEKLQIKAYLERKPRELSGGQRQRVAMGRAIVREPKVFLFDEPLSNLDAKLRVEMRRQIKSLQKELGVTSLYVTHDQTEAMTMADRLVVLKDGIVQQIGKPMEIYQHPANRFVAEFIGSPSINIIDSIRVNANDIALADGTTLPKPKFVQEADEMVLGIRPECVQLCAQEAPNALPFHVDIIERLGAESLLHGELNGCREHFVVKTAADETLGEGMNLWVHLPPEHSYLFAR